jgi:hypothetical protein
MTLIYTPPPAVGNAVAPVFCLSVTLAQIQLLIAQDNLQCNRLYKITDPFINPLGYGSVTVQAINSNTLNPLATWNRPGLITAVAAIVYDTSMAAGNTIDDVRVNGVSLNSAPIAFNTNIFQTMADLAADINLNTGTTGFKAVTAVNGIVINSILPGNTLNGVFPTTAVTGFPGSIYIGSFLGGEDPTKSTYYECKYSVGSGIMNEVTDITNNVVITGWLNDTFIFNFPFSYGTYINSTLTNCNIIKGELYPAQFQILNSNLTTVDISQLIYTRLTVNETKIKNFNLNNVGGTNFFANNCTVLYPIVQTFSGIQLEVFFNNVYTDGIVYNCSGEIAFTGNPGEGAVGFAVFMQTSPDRFCGVLGYGTYTNGNGTLIGNPGAHLEIGTNTTINGLCSASPLAAYNSPAVVGGSGNFGADPFGAFIITPTIADTTSGNLIYDIKGFLS